MTWYFPAVVSLSLGSVPAALVLESDMNSLWVLAAGLVSLTGRGFVGEKNEVKDV